MGVCCDAIVYKDLQSALVLLRTGSGQYHSFIEKGCSNLRVTVCKTLPFIAVLPNKFCVLP